MMKIFLCFLLFVLFFLLPVTGMPVSCSSIARFYYRYMFFSNFYINMSCFVLLFNNVGYQYIRILGCFIFSPLLNFKMPGVPTGGILGKKFTTQIFFNYDVILRWSTTYEISKVRFFAIWPYLPNRLL